ncbi:MAG: ATP-binding cassette domain-containing protein [Synechococcales cyanobacterium SupBloom_Metag_052]|nr:ATP-binding cassette domain-containing protein [Synechococcales cyanobacterium SupBloom_Metag_052]
MTSQPLLKVRHVAKLFRSADGSSRVAVLDDIDLDIQAGEVVALLGRSGSGKSTLLRLMAGLIAPSEGLIERDGQPLRGVNRDVAIVFQSFALLPWLTVLQNTGVGLEARGLGEKEVRRRALRALAMVGLEGSAEAFPRELSGGMRQRVGFARAFVMEPALLLMDEPFSALDVLTAENLRRDIDELWAGGTFPAGSIVIVTHSIEEAVLLSDRVVLLSANPGRIRGVVPNPLPRPRDDTAPDFRALVDTLYSYMTDPDKPVGTSPLAVEQTTSQDALALPPVSLGAVVDLLTLVPELEGISVAELADELVLELDDLLPILDAGELLELMAVDGARLGLSPVGRALAEASEEEQQRLLRSQLLLHVPLVRRLQEALEASPKAEVEGDFVLDLLSEQFTQPEAEAMFETLVSWIRACGLFRYSREQDRFRAGDALEQQEDGQT